MVESDANATVESSSSMGYEVIQACSYHSLTLHPLHVNVNAERRVRGVRATLRHSSSGSTHPGTFGACTFRGALSISNLDIC